MITSLVHRCRTVLVLAPLAVGCADSSETLRISSGMGQQHFWTGHHMETFADRIEAAGVGIEFSRFYSGSLVTPGQELNALENRIIDVAAPLLAPYNEGRFPLSDVTQLPTLDTTSVQITRAFQRLMDSERELSDGQTFYDYELGAKGIRGWPMGATSAYSLATTGAELTRPEDLEGLPVRAGSALHTMLLQELGATPVTMTSADSYEALSRNTVEGTILSVADWPSYSFQELLDYAIVGISMGHWESYLAVTEATWDAFTEAQRSAWDRIAREVAMANARHIDRAEVDVRERTSADGTTFVAMEALPQAMQRHLAGAASRAWIRWIEQLEADGHPARATALLWAELVREQGGALPAGAAEYLGVE